MNSLININDKGRTTARELYDFLQLAEGSFSRWAKTNIENDDYYQDGIDWWGFSIVLNGNETKDYEITIEFAKHLCLQSRSERGKQARNYFVEIERWYNQNINNTNRLPQVEVDMIAMKYTIDILRPSEASKITLLGKVYKQHNVSTTYLPQYTGEQLTYSLSELLKRHNVHMSAVAFNKRLLELGILEEKERPSTKGTKKFKCLTDKGMMFGKNLICPRNEKETQPHYYEASFNGLLNLIAN